MNTKKLPRIEFEINEEGQGKILINNKDIADILTAMTIDVRAGEIPKITLKTSSKIIGIVKGELKWQKNK